MSDVLEVDDDRCVGCGAGPDEMCRCDSDDDEGGECYWCEDGWVECPDPIECTRSHRVVRNGGGMEFQLCRCGSCGGSGLAKDMTIW